MNAEGDPVISAQVLLAPADGKLPADADIRAANVHQLMPSPVAAAAVTKLLAAAGFTVGPVVGPTFSITAPRSVFVKLLGAKAAGAAKGTVPLGRLPREVRRFVKAITFPPEPDFGPGNYS